MEEGESRKPLGHVLHPSDADCIRMLQIMRRGGDLGHDSVIAVDNLYEDHPEIVMAKIAPTIMLRNECCIYAPRKKVQGGYSREVVNTEGLWRVLGSIENILDEKEGVDKIGELTNLAYNEKGNHQTPWRLREYEVWPLTANEDAACKTICILYHAESPIWKLCHQLEKELESAKAKADKGKAKFIGCGPQNMEEGESRKPLGHVLHPSDADCIRMLQIMRRGGDLGHDSVIAVDNLYEDDPEIVMAKIAPTIMLRNECCIYAPRKKAQGGYSRVVKKTGGRWRAFGSKNNIFDEKERGGKIGELTNLAYNEKGNRQTPWRLREYEVWPLIANDDADCKTICILYHVECPIWNLCHQLEKELESAKAKPDKGKAKLIGCGPRKKSKNPAKDSLILYSDQRDSDEDIPQEVYADSVYTARRHRQQQMMLGTTSSKVEKTMDIGESSRREGVRGFETWGRVGPRTRSSAGGFKNRVINSSKIFDNAAGNKASDVVLSDSDSDDDLDLAETLLSIHKRADPMSTLLWNAAAISSPGKGILAVDDVLSSFPDKKAFCELLLGTPGAFNFLSGVILCEKTLFERTKSGKPFVDLITESGALPGITVDQGTKQLTRTINECTTVGLDSLEERCTKYYNAGARFAKWSACIRIGPNEPSQLAIEENVGCLARYALICQESGLVPIIEANIYVDGRHDINKCAEVTERTLSACYKALSDRRVMLEATVLRVGMVRPGSGSEKVSPQVVAEHTVRALQRTVPTAVPSVLFLSGGQDEHEATLNLNEINQGNKSKKPWLLSFAYGRALLESAFKAWSGFEANVKRAQGYFRARCEANSKASLGEYAG